TRRWPSPRTPRSAPSWNSAARRWRVPGGEFGADAGELILDRVRIEYLDLAAPAGEVPGDVQRGRGTDAHPAAPVVEFGVGVAVPAEVIAQDRYVPRFDEHGRPGTGTPLLHLADDLLPCAGQGEVVRPFGGAVGRLGRDDPVDAEGPLPSFGTGDQVPDVVLDRKSVV